MNTYVEGSWGFISSTVLPESILKECAEAELPPDPDDVIWRDLLASPHWSPGFGGILESLKEPDSFVGVCLLRDPSV